MYWQLVYNAMYENNMTEADFMPHKPASSLVQHTIHNAVNYEDDYLVLSCI